jgi:ribonuclease P protein component
LHIMERLKRRTDFRAAAAGTRAPSSAFVLQTRRRADDGGARVGFTVSRQVGNAVQRNRVRRRLREMVKRASPGSLRAGHDYVLIARQRALAAPFADMIGELDAALRRVHALERERTGGATRRSLHEPDSQADPRPLPHSRPGRNPPMHER